MRSQRTTSASSERKRGSTTRRGCANGRLPDHSRPHSPQLTENDISAALYPDAELAEQPRQERVVRLVVDDEAGVEREAAW